MADNADRVARAETLGDYFELQLLFAQRLAELGSLSLAEAVGRYTNFHKRFGLGAIEDGPPSIAWTRYTRALEALGSIPARVAWTKACFAEQPGEKPPAYRRAFGCFACDPPDEAGVLRIHFLNMDGP